MSSPRSATGSQPAMITPTAYVGYATRGIATRDPGSSPSIRGIEATSSLLPTPGTIAVGDTSTSRLRRSHRAQASRSGTDPHAVG